MDLFLSETFLQFVIASVLIELTPGPNMAYLAIISASEGRKAGFATVFGIALGLLTIGIAAALGLSAIITNSEIAYQGLRFAGIAYLFWLAWDGWKESSENSSAKTITKARSSQFFKRALITNLLNPKAAIFYIAVLPGFIGTSDVITSSLINLSLVFVLIATVIHASIVMLAGTAQKYLEDPKIDRLARRVFSLLLACVAIWFGLTTGRI